MTLYSVPPLLTMGCFVVLAIMSLVRGRKNRVNLLFISLCGLGALLYLDIFFTTVAASATTALFVSRLNHFFFVYSLPLYLLFWHTYLNITGRTLLVRIAFGYAAFLMLFTFTPFYFSGMVRHAYGFFPSGGPLYPFFAAGALGITVYALVILAQAIHTEQNSTARSKLKWVFVGFGVVGLMSGTNTLVTFGYLPYPLGNWSFIPLILFTWVVLKHDVLDTGLFVHKGLVYAIISILTTFVYAGVVIVAEIIFGGYRLSNSLPFTFCFFLLLALLFGPIQRIVQSLIDRLFYKGKYDYQKTVRQVSRMIATVRNLDQVAQWLTGTLINAMQLESCTLFLRTSPVKACLTAPVAPKSSIKPLINFTRCAGKGATAQSLPTDLEAGIVDRFLAQPKPLFTKRLNNTDHASDEWQLGQALSGRRIAVVLPMCFKKRLNGMIFLGEKRSGDLLSPEDLELLETLANQSALAVENAHSYQTVEDLNRNLEQKVRDRTLALREALAEKERTQEQLIRSESLAAIGQLVAGTAHEMNNPLASVASLVQSTIEDLQEWDENTPPDEDLIDDLQFALKELRRAKSIVASLLGLSRQTQTYTEEVDMGVVVQDALRVLHTQYKTHAFAIREDYAPDLPTISGNFANLGQVAINIIKNAIQAVDDQTGIVELSTGLDLAFQRVVFTCSDNGPGIPAGEWQDIYKPFFTTKPVGDGTGLGLYVCHEIITRHGGELTLTETAGGGATFRVSLPLNSD